MLVWKFSFYFSETQRQQLIHKSEPEVYDHHITQRKNICTARSVSKEIVEILTENEQTVEIGGVS